MTQGTQEWLDARAGMVTCSRLNAVLAGGTEVTRENYMAELIVARIGGQNEEGFKNSHMDRGTELEPLARMAYEIQTGEFVNQVGFLHHPTIVGFGGSPDGHTAKKAIQIKCLMSKKQLYTIETGKIDREYILQMHGEMMVLGLRECDFVSFDPQFPEPLNLYIQTIEFDDKIGDEITKGVSEFLHELNNRVMKLIIKYPSLAEKYQEWAASHIGGDK